jgi:tetratricopeptide (TPR) repeat protein
MADLQATPPGPQALLDAAWRARLVDDRFKLAHELIVASLEAARAQHDQRGIGNALLALSSNLLWYCPKEIEESDLSLDQLSDEALQMFREVGDEGGVAACLRQQFKFEESLAICQRTNNQPGLVRTLERLGCIAASRQDANKTVEYLKEALKVARDLNDDEILADVLKTTGICWPDDATLCRNALLEAAELYRQLGHRRDCAASLMICAQLTCDDDAPLKRQCLESACALWHDLERHEMERICLDLLAEMAGDRGDHVIARELRNRGEALRNLPEPD